MSNNNTSEKPFTFRFIDIGSKVLLELTNETERTFATIEILTVFLRGAEHQSNDGGQAHIRFDAIKSIKPKEKAVVSHRTWVDGRPVPAEEDQMEQLKLVAGLVNTYVLHLSWEDVDGKTQFQRIPVGH